MAQLQKIAALPWDVIVIGSGAGGGAFVWSLVSRRPGVRVLVLEKGPDLAGRRNAVPDEVGSCRRDEFVPFVGADPHVLADSAGARKSYEGWTSVCVGGGTVHMGALLFRMHPGDFDAATRHGVPAGTSLTNWPFGYDVLRPYYDRVEAQLALSGDSSRNPFEPPRAPFPLPPLPTHPIAAALDLAAAAAGAHAYPAPRGIVPKGSTGPRPACIECGFCGAYDCPVGAKASSPRSFLAGLPATVRILPNAPVVAVITDATQAATGVLVRHAGGDVVRIGASRVVLAASAVETARLLLLSRTAARPSGLGNAGDQVGRNLVFSLDTAGRAVFPYPSAQFPEADDRSMFVSRAVQDRYVDLEAPGGYPKAGTIFIDRAHQNPILRALRVARAGGRTRLGAELAEALGAHFRDERELAFEAFGEMLPRPGARVRLDPEVTDAGRLPAARIELDDDPHEPGRMARLASLAQAILSGLKPTRIEVDAAFRRTLFLQGGTARMGTDPGASVCDRAGEVHGTKGLLIVDGAALPTLGGVPPTLTIMANAVRIADGVT